MDEKMNQLFGARLPCRPADASWFYFLCILGLTLYLFSSPIEWFSRQLVSDPFNGLILLILPIVWLLRPEAGLQFRAPQYSLAPGILFFVTVISYLANENYLAVHIFSAALLIGAIYSLIGLVLPSAQWRVLFLPACLLVFVLPFGGYLDIYLGFPLRLLCADLSGELLRALGFSSLSSESIILIEEKAANVDLACSGIKGIWAGGIFYLLLGMIEAHRVSWRWFAIGVGFFSCLLAANVLRIVLLVLLGLVADFPQLAELLHACMGLLGFSVSCVLAWAALRLTRQEVESECEGAEHHGRHTSLMSAVFIGGLLLALSLLQPYSAGEATEPLVFSLATELQPADIPLTQFERDFFTSNQASVNKYRFNYDGLTGSALVVNSRYWKAQHEPHNCYLGQGYSLGYEGAWLLGNGSAVRFLQVDNATRTAVYWFQSVDRITPDYSARVLSGVLEPKQTWLMISILLDRSANQLALEPLLIAIQEDLAEQMSRGDK